MKKIISLFVFLLFCTMLYAQNYPSSFDYRKELKNLKMPVLIYGGRYDRVAVPVMMEKFKEYCPQAKFVMFEKSGHNPQIEEPSKLFPLIEGFLHQ